MTPRSPFPRPPPPRRPSRRKKSAWSQRTTRSWICCKIGAGGDVSLVHSAATVPWRARVPAGRWDMCTDTPEHQPDRGRPVHHLPVNADNRSIIVFLTVCTDGRKPHLAIPGMHNLLRTTWCHSTHWLVGRYVLMPDHLHLFCAPNSYPSTPLSLWVAYWKRQSAFAHVGRLWQKNFWDVQLRGHE